jgi:hypothetical protein
MRNTDVLLILRLLIAGIVLGAFWIWAVQAVARWGLQRMRLAKRRTAQSRRKYASRALSTTAADCREGREAIVTGRSGLGSQM